MEIQDKHNINRRDFLKIVGISTASAAPLLSGCSSDKTEGAAAGPLGEVPTDKMTYRTSPKGEKISLLGYGCMRWPTIRLVDYAIAHGVNYFDTSPVYVQGWSEKSTGIALKRHPREKLIIATKLSNFQNWTRENSIAMYKQSLKDLQTDYIDYYLLHSIGNGGIETFRARYIDNGMLDYLIEERKAGRIRNLGFSFHGTVDVFDEVLAMHDHVELCGLAPCFRTECECRISVC